MTGHPGASLPPSAAAGEVDDFTILEFAGVLLEQWRLIVGLPVLAAVLAAVISLLLPTKYTAVTTFVPETDQPEVSLPSGVSGLASRFGIALPGGGATSPRFYAHLLESRTIRDQLLLHRFAMQGGVTADSASLLDILEIDGDRQRTRLEAGREKLGGMIGTSTDIETNVLRVAVETGDPVLSADVANVLVGLLNRFNLETRQTTGGERRRFSEERLEDADRELEAAENQLKTFLEKNRQFRGSPDLTFQHERLQRQVRIKEEVVTVLRTQYEEARMQEVNDTPLITVIDRAVPPDEKSSPKRRQMVLLAFFLAAIVAVFVAFGRHALARARSRDQHGYASLASHWAGLKADVRAVLRRRS